MKLSMVALACDTPEAAGAADVHVVPLDTKTLPVVPGATTWNADVPLPSKTLLAVNVAAPVPPEPTATGVVADKVVNAPDAGVVAPTVPFNGPAKPEEVNTVPLHVREAEPANTPELLN